MGFKNILKCAFPFLAAGASLGGPLGAMAANAVGQALGIDKVPPTPDGISDAIAAAQSKDPDALVKLKAAEQDFELQMKKLGFDTVEKLEQLDVEDRANARAREIAVKDRLPAILALLVTGGFFSLLGVLSFRAVPSDSATILNVMVGSLGTAWVGVINYYFGSSSGSAAKTQILADQASRK